MERGRKGPHENHDDNEIRLKRQLSWIGGTAVLVGSVIGSGIFVMPSSIFRNSGSVGVALLIWCISGVISLMGNGELEAPAFSTNVKTSGITDAFYGALMSFGGWKHVSFIAEEMVNPARDLQKSLLAGLLVVTVVYVLTNLSYAMVLDFETLTSTEAIASAFALKTWGEVGYVAVPVAVSVSVFGMLYASFFSASRFVLAAARTGHLPRILSLVTVESRVPRTCVIFKGALVIAFIFFGSLEALIQVSVFLLTMWDIFVVIALLILRLTIKDRGRSYKAPLLVVLLKLVSSVALIIIPLVKPTNYFVYLVIVGVYVMGLLYYVLFVGKRWDCRASRALTELLQKLTLSVPCFDELTFMLDGKKYDAPNDPKEFIADISRPGQRKIASPSVFLEESSEESNLESAPQRNATTRRFLNPSPAKQTYSTIDTTVTRF
ncbi:hypothetical protein MTO96_048888 [Rhipicephalus appendiculatus]